MIDRPDAVLAAVPALAVSGLVIRSIITATGLATGLLAVPLAPLGYLSALALIFGELLAGPVAQRTDGGST
ncbi:hypothetical protein [Natrarchaeobius chitinivorans]|uniref:Uncharacterized protein n=1 Tax=Natrarchaeobius chitinivorans TaxID=1679083 RepID=A0A3N6P5F9_NATCH|nr:hypothetical protein [Natrarchaeobius chitinivorans]RQG93349.1 hypothetical protein EA473_15060 [Natrarchaeobius chitinivorans]